MAGVTRIGEASAAGTAVAVAVGLGQTEGVG